MSDWYAWMNDASGLWREVMVRGCWQGGLALVVAWTFCAALGRWVGGRGRSWAWRLGYAKFLLCLLSLAPVTLAVLPPRPMAEVPPPIALDDVPDPPLAVPGVETAHAERGIRAETWWMLLWSAGVAVCLGRLGWVWRQARRLRGTAVKKSYGQTCAELGRIMGLCKVPEVMVSQAVHSPMLMGIWSPVILLPEGMKEDDARLALAHELGHLQRRDLVWNWVEIVVAAAFFFHPLVWWGRRQWRLAQEVACDEAVLAGTGASRSAYGRMLVDMVRRGKAGPPAAMAGVGIVESKGMLTRRLAVMSDFRTWSRRRVAAVAAVLVLAGVVGLVPWTLAQAAPASRSGAPDIGTSSRPATAPNIPVFQGGDPEKVEISERVITQVIPLKNLDAVQLHTDLLPMVSSDATFVANKAANTLIITDTSARIHRLLEIIQKLDSGKGPAVRPVSATGGARPAAEYGGMLSAPTARLIAPKDGIVDVATVKDGQRVKKGDILFEVDVGSAKAAFAAAQQRVEDAIARAKTTGGADAVREAQVALDAAKRELDATRVTAPFDGVLTTSDVTDHQYVAKGTLLTQVVKVDDLRVDFAVPQDALETFHPGQKAFVRTARATNPETACEIVYIAPLVDPSSGTATVRAKVLGQDAILRPGMTCQVRVPPE